MIKALNHLNVYIIFLHFPMQIDKNRVCVILCVCVIGCVCDCVCVSNRGGQLCFGDVAAHGCVLIVFAGVQWNLLKVTLCDGALSP